MKFTDDKAQVLLMNREDPNEGRTWRLGKVTISHTKEYKCLGMSEDEKGLKMKN